MDRESVERLRFDRRLKRRRDWVSDEALEEHLASLPDVSGNMTTAAELEAEQGETRESPPARSGAAAGHEPAPEGSSSPFGAGTTLGGGFGND